MKALIIGFLGVFGLVLAFGFLVTYPAAFWTVIFIFVGLVALVFVLGTRQSQGYVQPPASLRNAKSKYSGDDEEGDIRHHYNYGGTPLNIGNPGTIQNQSVSFGHDDEDEDNR
jgi:hypothetical protein